MNKPPDAPLPSLVPVESKPASPAEADGALPVVADTSPAVVLAGLPVPVIDPPGVEPIHRLRFVMALADLIRLRRSLVVRERRIGRAVTRSESLLLPVGAADSVEDGAPDNGAPHNGASVESTVTLWRLGLEPVGIAELVVQDATFAVGNLRQSCCLVELSLLTGAAPGLFALAKALAQALPLQPVSEDLETRARAFVAGVQPRAVRAGPVALAGGQSGVQALAAILEGCRTQILANEPAVSEARLPEGIHQMRVALRRLRAALALFKPYLPADLVAGLRGESAWAAGALGPIRDLDVFVDETLIPLGTRLSGETGLALLASNAQKLRQQHAAAGLAAVRSSRFVVLTIALAELVAALETGARDPMAQWLDPLRPPIAAIAPLLLEKRWKALRKAGRGFAGLSEHARHEVRIQGKKLRYAVDFFADLFPGRRLRRFAGRLGALQEVLGFGQDLAVQSLVLDQLLAGGGDAVELARASGIIDGWRLARADRLETQSRARWAAVKSAVPFWLEA